MRVYEDDPLLKLPPCPFGVPTSHEISSLYKVKVIESHVGVWKSSLVMSLLLTHC
jgi:hypothetical protein